MNVPDFARIFKRALSEDLRFDDLVEAEGERYLNGRTFEQELHRLASLDLAAETF